MRIVALDTCDIRLPASRQLDGSGARNPDPDHPASYVVLRTGAPDDLVDPVVACGGRYVTPAAPGFSATMRPETLARYAYPNGPMWKTPDPTPAAG